MRASSRAQWIEARRRHQRGEPVEQFERGQGEFGLAGGLGPGQAVADGLVGAVPAEPLADEGGSGAVAQQPFEAGAVLGLDAHGGVQREAAAVTPAGEVGGDLRGEGAVADGEPQHPAADPPRHGAGGGTAAPES